MAKHKPELFIDTQKLTDVAMIARVEKELEEDSITPRTLVSKTLLQSTGVERGWIHSRIQNLGDILSTLKQSLHTVTELKVLQDGLKKCGVSSGGVAGVVTQTKTLLANVLTDAEYKVQAVTDYLSQLRGFDQFIQNNLE